ncbi:universal stress protein [Sinomicrobium weinanense]|uniref:Universal stress protein n=1 Tax=Sinomicrobium weinanense TaxID=2842200 RepID=A0A926JQS1_9FLAO|nr:universal stress protein [Sinomicrobium weinanense]MBC9795767.1 universal stress protein [Sinomicrobium weinanense]MBU3121811.1 universal stress protein [Sinomicrobium weinanense]
MKKIIVPTDFSECSEYALRAAADIAREKGAGIVLFHMVGVSAAVLAKDESQEYAEAMYYMKLARKKFDGLLSEDYLKGISTEEVVQNYKDFSEINQVAKEKGADLIVMGSHGTGAISGLFVGSNTEKVVRNSDTPVLVLKKPVKKFKMEKVVFACDFELESIHVYRKAMRFFDTFQSEVSLVYVNLPGEGFRDSVEFDEKVEDFLYHAEGSLKHREKVHFRNAYAKEEGIYAFAEKIGADLIAIPTHGRKGLSHFFRGSLAEDMANRARFPVMTFKIY